MKPKYLLSFFLLAQLVFLKIIPSFPSAVERIYSNGIYPVLSTFSRIIFGSVPFSIGDFIYLITAIFILFWLWKKRLTWKNEWKNNILVVVSFISIFYFFFHFLWAINYYREPLFEKMKIRNQYSDVELLTFTKKLILKTNSIQFAITKNKNLKVNFPYTQEQVFKMNVNGYLKLAESYPYFKYENISTKKSLFSLPLSYMGFGGYLNPFTNEAQVNDRGPMYSFPMTTNHEMAHQMGYASESECNFIGFLSSVKNDDIHVKYSGYSFALRYCMNILSDRDKSAHYNLLKTINPGILKNYRESEIFWKQHESPVEEAFHVFYDNFLKFNQQKDGIESYSKFVNLMVNYYKTNEL